MATLQQRITDLATAIGADVKALRAADGSLSSLSTSSKNNLVAAINEVYSLAQTSTALINDSAGDGVTNKTWSADKIYDSILASINALRTELTAGASSALDTFAELATALGNDPNFASTIAAGLNNRVRFDSAQTLTAAQKTQARDNIGAQDAAAIGNPDTDLAAIYNAAKV
ncbi:MAG: hypothetical protein RLY58_841 [Pseudomonadota bacterium]|jgi:hypothetical protein